MDPIELYRAASAWTLTKAAGAAADLDARTPCEDWDVRTLMNHMLQTQQYFTNAAQGRDATPPGQQPPRDLLGVSPAADFERARIEALQVFGEDGVLERTGPMLGIAASDQLLHGWDLARATGQDETMPAELAEAAYGVIHGAFTEDQREGVFAPEIAVPDTASAQERLLAYAGRDPGLVRF